MVRSICLGSRLFGGSLLALLLACATQVDAAKRPNVVLFLVDDMGWMDCEPYGSQYYETPNMTRLAGQSMRFTDAYAVPLCSPTRATILSGQYSARHGVTSASGHQPARRRGASRYPAKTSPAKQFIYPLSKNYLDPALVTLAEVLRQNGYRTGHFGKWHLGIAPEHRPDRHGFESTWFCVPDPGPPSYFSPYGVHREGDPTSRHRVGNISDGPIGEYITDRLTDEAVHFLESCRDEPFFLNLWHYGVHGPWGHKEQYTAEFARKTDPRGEQRNPIMASMLRSIDESLGRVLDKIEQLELAENTLFIFYSDNGGNTHSNRADDRKLADLPPNHPRQELLKDWRKWAGGEPPTNNAPLREGKGRIYEGGQRVPLMIRWPGRIEPGSTSDAVVGPIDLYPTILAALRLARPAQHILDGQSLLPVLQGEGSLERQALFTWFPHLIPAVSVRAGDWKLIRRWEPHRNYPEVRELYNLKTDLGETRNLAGKMPEKVAQLEALIDSFLADTGALVPRPNPTYRESAAAARRGPDAGLVPKSCKATLADGCLRVERDGQRPFLGTAQVRNLTGPLTLRMRMKGPAGRASVRWKRADQDAFPRQGQLVNYSLPDSNTWQEVTVDIPIDGKPAIVRLYLPATDKAPVEIESIEFTDRKGARKTWDFSGPNAAGEQ